MNMVLQLLTIYNSVNSHFLIRFLPSISVFESARVFVIHSLIEANVSHFECLLSVCTCYRPLVIIVVHLSFISKKGVKGMLGNKRIIYLVATQCIAFQVFAQDEGKLDKLQDMSDPLAVYTQAGVGLSDKGFNIKVGQMYKPGKADMMAMNLFEAKGIGGGLLGIRNNDKPIYGNVDDSIDSFRLRNTQVNVKKGRGSQLDINYDVDHDKLDASYNIIQALPKMGFIQFYPLAGVGVTVANDTENGYEIPGTFTVVGMYSKVEVSDKVWINYNPMYMHTLSGADDYKSQYYMGANNILTQEFALSYQITPRFNVRYFANWNENVKFGDGDHRIEFNYQL